MTIGDGAPYLGYDSAIGVAEETAYGTFKTSTAFIEFNTEAMKQEREEMKLASINTTRDYTKRLIMNETVSGSIEAPFNAAEDAMALIVKQAMGGTSTVNTIAAGAVEHTFLAGDMESNKGTSTATDIKGLSVAVRRGGARATNNTFNYAGCRVNTLTIKGEVGSPVLLTAELIGQTASMSATIPTVSFSNVLPLNFVGISITSGDSITNLSVEYFTSFEFVLTNNLSDQRRLGSRSVSTLPPVMRDISLTLGQRFDTITAYERFKTNTLTAIKIVCDSATTITAGGTTYAMWIDLPECFLNSNEPEVGGPDPLTHELNFTAMFADYTATSYANNITIRNATANYF